MEAGAKTSRPPFRPASVFNDFMPAGEAGGKKKQKFKNTHVRFGKNQKYIGTSVFSTPSLEKKRIFCFPKRTFDSVAPETRNFEGGLGGQNCYSPWGRRNSGLLIFP